MPRRKMRKGICHICGNYGDLTYDHVPPQKAFNDRKFYTASGQDIIGLGPDEYSKGKCFQGGIGYYSLCPRCNNVTGSWYGSDFVKWSHEAKEILLKSKGSPKLIYPYTIYPLRIIKQIVTMFLSATNRGFAEAHPNLTHFVLNKLEKNLPPKYRFFIYYNLVGKFRKTGVACLLNLKTGSSSILNEINYPPFGYVITLDSEPPKKFLVEITHFSHYGYYERKEIWLKLPVLPTYLPYPGDYRTREEIYNQAKESSM